MSEMNIVEEKSNPLFNRKEVKVQINADVPPKISEAEDLIAEKFSVAKENVKIKNVTGTFGSTEFEISANIYDSAKNKNEIEVKTKKQRAAEKKAAHEKLKTDAEERKKTKEAEEKPTEEVTNSEEKSEEVKEVSTE